MLKGIPPRLSADQAEANAYSRYLAQLCTKLQQAIRQRKQPR